MPHVMESPKMEQVGQWARTVISRKENLAKSPTCKLNPLARKTLKQPCLHRQLKSPKCYIKITGSRYNGTFLLNIDDDLDDAIFQTMRDIEVALEEQADPLGKPKVCPKNCLSSVFQCFGTSDLGTKAVCNRKKPRKSIKSIKKPAECSLTATINKSDLGPLINAVQSNPFNSEFNTPEISGGRDVMRDFVDVFRTTMNQFSTENLSSFKAPPPQLPAEQSTHLGPKKSPPMKMSITESIDMSNEMNEELKKVAYIKFSQEEVLVIQPPKPSNNDTKQLEVGIEVKPKTTASNVGQSIKLAKDKVLIGMQDGTGVLQINESLPKRSLQMVIEEGVNGKTSMKLNLKEEGQDQKETPTTGENHIDVNVRQDKEVIKTNCANSKCNRNGSLYTVANNNETTKNSIFHVDVEKFKSVESQVSWAQLKDMGTAPSENRTFILETMQNCDISSVQPLSASHCVGGPVETKPLATVNQLSDPPSVKKSSEIPMLRDSRLNRTPFLVHTLYEPRSLNNSSAYFASDKPSIHCGSMRKARVTRKFEGTKKQTRKQKSFSFSSDNSCSSKCTKIFRDIGDIREKGSRPLSKKDARMTASLIEDFEKILQNMCGPSYLYHHPEPPESEPSKGMKHQVLKARKLSSGSMSFDQWTQTESCTQEIKTGFEPTAKVHMKKHKTPKARESGDGSHPNIVRKKDKRTISNASQRFAESSFSVSTSGLDDGFSSDSSDSIKHKLVFSMLAASDENPLTRTSSQVINENWIEGKAKSFVGQKIFDAIEDHSSHPKLFGDIKKIDSFVYPACKDSSGVLLQGKNVSLAVNMALCDGPTGSSLIEITGDCPTEVKMDYGEGIKPLKLEEQWNHNSTIQASAQPSFPVRVKSKSCQNLLTPRGSQSMEHAENSCTRTQIKKLRYPQLTATDARHTSILNACGILNFNEGGTKTSDQSLVTLDHLNPGVNRSLPSAIRSLLLPRPHSSVILNSHEQPPTYCCDSLMNYMADYHWDSFNEHNHWDRTDLGSVKTVAVHHRGVFKRTFFVMKSVRTVVSRKFSHIFRKLSFAHSEKENKNSVTNDRLPYVAIPLKKKSDNLHLYPRLQ